MPENRSRQKRKSRHHVRWRDSRPRRYLAWLTIVTCCVCLFSPASAQEVSEGTTGADGGAVNSPLDNLSGGPDQWTSPEGLSSSIQVMLLLTVISMAPAVLLMTTSFVRIVVVLGLLRQALGTQQLPPSQVITSIAMFLSLLIMTPVWTRVYDDAIKPYTNKEVDPATGKPISLEVTWQRGVQPIREFMSLQIERAGNSDDVWLFYNYLPEDTTEPTSYDDVPLQVLLPAYMLSELKTAFLIGFQIYLPFLILDIVVASVTISMGMMMLPPVLISLPFKLLLFVLVDGWHLVIEMLMNSFQPFP